MATFIMQGQWDEEGSENDYFTRKRETVLKI
jgi:hypothetical protein